MTKITVNLKEHMDKKGWTARDLAYHANTTFQTIYHYLGDPKRIDLALVCRMADALGVSPLDIIVVE